jgi:hypothetical protein
MQQSSNPDDERPSPLAYLIIELTPLALWDAIEDAIASSEPETTA